MNDEIEPGPSMVIEDAKDVIRGNWRRCIFTDEVFWKYEINEVYQWHHNVARFPFVPGYFLCRVVSGTVNEFGEWYDHECHFPEAGPFPTLKAAKAAALVLGPTKHDE